MTPVEWVEGFQAGGQLAISAGAWIVFGAVVAVVAVGVGAMCSLIAGDADVRLAYRTSSKADIRAINRERLYRREALPWTDEPARFDWPDGRAG